MAKKAKTKAPEKVNWTERFDRAYKAAKERQERAIQSFGDPKKPPVEPSELTSETVIEGKPVSFWAQSEESLPGWASWAVRKWKANGTPTPDSKVLAIITEIRENAEKQAKFAALDKEKAARISDPIKAKKLLAAAQKKSEKAELLFAEADKIAKEHKEKA